jgi:hypothetical protein
MYVLLLLVFAVCVGGAEIGYQIVPFNPTNNHRFVHQLDNIDLNDLLHMNITMLNAAYGGNLIDTRGSNPPCAGLGRACFAINADRDKYATHHTITPTSSSSSFKLGGVYKIFNIVFVIYTPDCGSVSIYHGRYIFEFFNAGEAYKWRLQQVDVGTDYNLLEFLRVMQKCFDTEILPRIALYELNDTSTRPIINCNDANTDVYDTLDVTFMRNRSLLLPPPVETTIIPSTCATCHDKHHCTITLQTDQRPLFGFYADPTPCPETVECDIQSNALTTEIAGNTSQQAAYEAWINTVDIKIALNATIPFFNGTDYGSFSKCAGIENTRTCMPAIEYRWAPFRLISNPHDNDYFLVGHIYSVIPVLIVAITHDEVEIRRWVRFVFFYNRVLDIFQLIHVETDTATATAINTGCFASQTQPSLLLWPPQSSYPYGVCDAGIGYDYPLAASLPACSGIDGVAYTLQQATEPISCAPGCHETLRNVSIALNTDGACECHLNSGYINPARTNMGLCPVVTTSILCTIPEGCLRGSEFIPVYHTVYSGLTNAEAIGDVVNGLGDLTPAEYLTLAGNPQTRWFDTSWAIAWWDFDLFYTYDVVVNVSDCQQNPDASPFSGVCAGIVGTGGERYLYKIVPIIMYGYTYGTNKPYDNVGIATFTLTFVYDTLFPEWIAISATVNDWVGLSFIGHYPIGNGRMPLTDDTSLNLNTGYCSPDPEIQCGYDVIIPTLKETLSLAETVNVCGNYTITMDMSECDTDAAYRFINYDVAYEEFTPRVNYNLVSASYFEFISACIPPLEARRTPCPGKVIDPGTRVYNEYLRNLLRATLASPGKYALLSHISEVVNDQIIWLVVYVMHDTATDEPYTGSINAVFELVQVNYSTSNFTWAFVELTTNFFIYSDLQSNDGVTCETALVTSTCVAAACGGSCFTYTYYNVTTVGTGSVRECANVGAFTRNVNKTTTCLSPEAAALVRIRSISELLTPDILVKQLVYFTIPLIVAVTSGIMLGVR